MQDFVFISEAARELNAQTGISVRPQDITNLFYGRALRADLCPVVGGRRLIPREYLAVIAQHLRCPTSIRRKGGK